jgi:hypothetical protein
VAGEPVIFQPSKAIPDLLAGLFDDASVFPPGNMPLEQAVLTHIAHMNGAHRRLVGPFILKAADLRRLADLTDELPVAAFPVSLTVPLPDLAAALAEAERTEALELVGLEVTVPDEVAPQDIVPALGKALGWRTVPVYVEIPRDQRRYPLLEELAAAGLMAKFRTGGVRAELYPDEIELAAAIGAAVEAGVPFKATAGLHHALRNTDPDTGFEQHGFLNLLAATDAALDGADPDELVELLAERSSSRLGVKPVPLRARALFRSFGTCSIAEPARELAALGMLPETVITDLIEESP